MSQVVKQKKGIGPDLSGGVADVSTGEGNHSPPAMKPQRRLRVGGRADTVKYREGKTGLQDVSWSTNLRKGRGRPDFVRGVRGFETK